MSAGRGGGVGGSGGSGLSTLLSIRVTHKTTTRTMIKRIPPPITEYFKIFLFLLPESKSSSSIFVADTSLLVTLTA
jgi:hypothetical protein